MVITEFSPAGTGVEDEEVILRKDTQGEPSDAGDNTCCLCFVGDPNNCLMIGNVSLHNFVMCLIYYRSRMCSFLHFWLPKHRLSWK